MQARSPKSVTAIPQASYTPRQLIPKIPLTPKFLYTQESDSKTIKQIRNPPNPHPRLNPPPSPPLKSLNFSTKQSRPPFLPVRLQGLETLWSMGIRGRKASRPLHMQYRCNRNDYRINSFEPEICICNGNYLEFKRGYVSVVRDFLLKFPEISLCNGNWFFWQRDSASVIGNLFLPEKVSVCSQFLDATVPWRAAWLHL